MSFTHITPRLSLRRARVTRIVATLTGALAVMLASVAPSLANSFPNQQIANIALSYPIGAYGGQCYVFVNNVLLRASGGQVHIGGWHTYYGAYARAGGVLVSANQARPGDIIQISNPNQDNTYFPGMHTAIIVANLGGGNFDVVDSNWGYTEQIHHHHLNPYALVEARFRESIQFWRMGQVASQPAPQPQPQPNHVFTVYGISAGNVLNMRSGPGKTYPVVGALSPGQAVNITCQTRGSYVGGSGVWDEINPGRFVSDWYINTPVVDQFTPSVPQC